IGPVGQGGQAQKVLQPIFGIIAVAVHRKYLESRFPVFIENQAALVQLIDVDSLLDQDFQIVTLLMKLQEVVFKFTFENAHGIHLFVVRSHVTEMHHINLPVFDVGVVGLFKEVGGDLLGDLMALGGSIEKFTDQTMDRVEFQIDLIGKAVVVLFLFPEGLEKIFLQQTGGLVIGGEGDLG